MSERVLLVDDEQEFLDALAERMRNRGIDVSTCNSAVDALAKVEDKSFDAIVLDLRMPGIDGMQALKLIKERRPELQVILLTGQATVEKGVEAMKLGAAEFLEKPANIDVLTERIKKAQAQKVILVEKKAEELIKRLMVEKGW